MSRLPIRCELCLSILLACCAAACDSVSGDPNKIAVVYLGEQRMTLAELQGYLDANMLRLGEDDDRRMTGLDSVKSRLLDAYVEERLLLAEAGRRGLKVEEWEIDAYLAMDEPDEELDAAGIEARRQLARKRLMVQMLREGTILGLPPLEEEEVRRHADKHGERLLSERRLRLRALLLDSEDEAQGVYTEIRRRRITFDEAVAAYESYPGQVRSLSIALESLSEEARTALEGLEPGQVSPPLEVQGCHYVFKIESWLRDPEQIAEERELLARQELQDLRRQQALEELFLELQQRYPVRIIRRNLPFRYVKEGAERGRGQAPEENSG
jgi:peptidyl-prolyl cis-trans isomerase C